MSSARHADEFVVREHFAEDRPRVVLVVDRRPSMSLYPAEPPWLHKPAAVAAAGRMIVEARLRRRAFPDYLDFADADIPRWLPPNRRENAAAHPRARARAPDVHGAEDILIARFRHLDRARPMFPPGSFVFVLSDFLRLPLRRSWRVGLARSAGISSP